MPASMEVSVELDLDIAEGTKQAQLERILDGADKGFAVSQELVPQDQGKLLQSGFNPTIRNGSIVWGYSGPDYVRDVEFGTGPRPVPMQPLMEWGDRVLGSRQAGAKVAQKIRERGQNEQPFVRPGVEDMKQWIKNHSISDYIDDQL